MATAHFHDILQVIPVLQDKSLVRQLLFCTVHEQERRIVMKAAMFVVFAVSFAAAAGQIAVDPCSVQEKDPEWLVYDDGTAAWMGWGGMLRGVWFNVEDFNPSGAGAIVSQTEFWFYHHSSFPWDTSDFYAEVWNGDSTGPIDRLDQTQATAVPFAPVIVTYDPAIVCEAEFWVLVSTELSSGGWPSSLSDGTPGTHSFYSDGSSWVPWEMGDYFIRACAEITLALDNTTWGELKTVF
jgi:hypothetical protein